MKDKFLIDTSIFVYAFDETEPVKRAKCKEFIENVLYNESVYISNQIFAELYYVLTKIMRTPIKEEDAQSIVKGFNDSVNWKKINYTHLTVLRAMYLSKSFQVDFWDSLIAATMIENNVFTVVTENEKDFRKIPMLKVVNPMKG